jgi:lipopolysaccharide transport system permease protein
VRPLVAVWPWRTLVSVLVAKDLKTRYRGSVMGLLWTLLNPLLMMLVYTLVFSVYMRVPVEHYPVFAFAGLLPWIWFSTSLSQATVAVVREGHLLRKVRFPAEILPFTAVASTGVNFLLTLPLYLALALIFGVRLGWSLLWAPVLLALSFLLQYGLALALAALNVRFRDVEHLTANILSLLFFLTPILYAETWIPERFRSLALASPAAALVLSWRDILFAGRSPSGYNLAILAVSAAVAVIGGGAIFRRMSPRFAEEV